VGKEQRPPGLIVIATLVIIIVIGQGRR